MKVLRVLTVLVLVVTSAVAATPASADHTLVPPIDRSPLPDLAGRTTILGARTGWMRVRLPETIDPEKMDWLDLTVRGRGRFIGAFLFREIDGEVDTSRANLSFFRFGECAGKACKPPPYRIAQVGGTAWDRQRLPAGIYRLYLIVDGAPASVYFTTPELPGVVRLNPTRRHVQVRIHDMTPRVYTPGAGTFFSAGDARPFGGDGVAMQAQWVDPIGVGVFDWGTCVYEKEAPPDHTTAYLPAPPGCPTSPSWHLWAMHPYTPLSDVCCWGVQMEIPYLPKAMGNWFALSGPAESFGATAMWLRVGD